jgi:hypothetical protein
MAQGKDDSNDLFGCKRPHVWVKCMWLLTLEYDY